jgi:hypothetical protein
MPADVWRNNERSFTKGFFTNEPVTHVVLDPDQVYADVDRSDNEWAVPTINQGEQPGVN